MALHPSVVRRTARRLAVVALTAALAVALAGPAPAAPTAPPTAAPAGAPTVAAAVPTAASRVASAAANPVTPGNFTGYGFDQCLTPTQAAMTAWLNSSPFWAVGVYLSGDSRACRHQPNLTPAWVARQLADGWRLLPVTLGPQASCNPRFPRYDDDETIDPSSAGSYRAAGRQGTAEATLAVAEARRLGIRAGSTLWYDMEAYDIGNRHCRESALRFTSAWTERLHALGYVAGVYSSAGSHIKALDDARVTRPGTYTMPDRIWFARWDGVRTTSTPYVRSDGWLPGGRVKQYRGGHDETHGGVRINIDSNWLDLGRGSRAAPEPSYCGGVKVSFGRYPRLVPGAKGTWVRTAQCLLNRAGYDPGPLSWTFNRATEAAVSRYRADHGMGSTVVVDAAMWTALLSRGYRPLTKYGAANEAVRRLQRALNAASGEPSPVTGTFAGDTHHAVRDYRRTVGLPGTGVATPEVWARLQAGRIG